MSAGGNPTSHSLLDTFALSDDLFVTRGRHSIQFGTLLNHFVQFTQNGTGTFGSISFSSLATFLEASPTSYVDYAPPVNNIRDVRYNTIGFYGQDDWKATSRLTLNLGLRYEFNTNATEIHGNSNAFRNIVTDTFLTPGDFTTNPSYLNFSPRTGFAWDVQGNGKTSVRGGLALLYNIAGWYGTLHQMKIAPFQNQITKNFPTPPVGTIFPDTFTVPFVLDTSNLTARGGQAYDYNMKQAKLLQYNLSVQRQLPFATAITLAYGASRGYNLMALPNVNPVIPQGIPGTDANGLETCVVRPTSYNPIALDQQQYTDGSANTCWLGTAITNSSPLTKPTEVRRNPNWNDFGWISNNALSWYNSLQVTVEKHVTHGLQFQFNYTWSKLLDTDQGQSTQDTAVSFSTAPVDELHINRQRAPGAFNVPFAYHFNALYGIPNYKGNRFAEKVLDGWLVSGIVQVQSGYPFTPTFSTSRSREYNGGNAGGIDRPNVKPGRNNGNITRGTTAGCQGVAAGQKLGTPTLYFDPCAFSIQPTGFLGNEPLNALIGPPYQDIDFSMVKDTRAGFLGEAGAVEFRAEVFDVFNHSNFNQPTRTIFSGNGQATGDVEPVSGGAGSVTTAFPARQIQLALKLIF